jgi:hypothetical protein
VREVREERGPVAKDKGFSGDAALQRSEAAAANGGMIPSPLLTFEGLANQDNFDIFGFRVNPPDPNGDVGPNHYVEMINLAFAVYSKTGTLLLGPVDTGTLWTDFEVPDCTDPSGDPIVLYDQLADRWILSQFTTAGPTYYNCIAISTTGDFAVSSTTCTASLPSKGKCKINLTFTPTAKGQRTGQLIVNDSASNSPQTSSLTVTGK